MFAAHASRRGRRGWRRGGLRSVARVVVCARRVSTRAGRAARRGARVHRGVCRGAVCVGPTSIDALCIRATNVALCDSWLAPRSESAAVRAHATGLATDAGRAQGRRVHTARQALRVQPARAALRQLAGLGFHRIDQPVSLTVMPLHSAPWSQPQRRMVTKAARAARAASGESDADADAGAAESGACRADEAAAGSLDAGLGASQTHEEARSRAEEAAEVAGVAGVAGVAKAAGGQHVAKVAGGQKGEAGAGPAPAPKQVLAATDEEDAPGDGLMGLPKGMARAVFILTSSQFIVTAGFGMIIPVLPLLSAQLGLGASGVGAILAAPSATRVLLNMFFGSLADRIGRKPLMVGGTLASALGAVGTAYAWNLASLIPVRALVGAGSSASMAGSSAYMADLTARVPHKRAKLLGVQQTIIIGSFVAGPAIGGWLATMHGPQAAFMLVGAFTGVSSLMYSILPETLAKRQLPAWLGGPRIGRGGASPAGAEAGPSSSERREEPLWQTFAKLVRNRHQQAIIAMNVGLSLVYSAQLSVVPLHAHAVWDASPGEIGIMFSLVSMLGLIGAPLGGWAADRIGRKQVVLPAASLAALGMFSLALATDTMQFGLCMALIGLGSSTLTPGLTAYAADVAPPDQRAQALSVSRQAGDIIFATAPLGLGLLADLCSNSIALGCTAGMTLAVTSIFAMRADGGIPAVDDGQPDDSANAQR